MKQKRRSAHTSKLHINPLLYFLMGTWRKFKNHFLISIHLFRLRCRWLKWWEWVTARLLDDLWNTWLLHASPAGVRVFKVQSVTIFTFLFFSHPIQGWVKIRVIKTFISIKKKKKIQISQIFFFLIPVVYIDTETGNKPPPLWPL